MSGPLPYRWDGESLIPLRPKLCDKELVVDAIYFMEPEASRSDASHRHQFAWLREAWLNLPEEMHELFPTEESLRKFALIRAGYCDVTEIRCGSPEGAREVAGHLKRKDGFADVQISGSTVIERVAKSQSRRAMKPKDFQDSKTKVLEIVAALIGVEPEELERNAGKAA